MYYCRVEGIGFDELSTSRERIPDYGGREIKRARSLLGTEMLVLKVPAHFSEDSKPFERIYSRKYPQKPSPSWPRNPS